MTRCRVSLFGESLVRTSKRERQNIKNESAEISNKLTHYSPFLPPWQPVTLFLTASHSFCELLYLSTDQYNNIIIKSKWRQLIIILTIPNPNADLDIPNMWSTPPRGCHLKIKKGKNPLYSSGRVPPPKKKIPPFWHNCKKLFRRSSFGALTQLEGHGCIATKFKIH